MIALLFVECHCSSYLVGHKLRGLDSLVVMDLLRPRLQVRDLFRREEIADNEIAIILEEGDVACRNHDQGSL